MTLEADARRNSSSGYYTREFRALSLARHEESGLNAAAFCRQEGINSRTFSRWRKQTRCQSSPGLVLAPVGVLQDVPGSDTVSHVVELELHLKNGRCVVSALRTTSTLIFPNLDNRHA